jgi:hypothetical protein
VGVEAAVQTLHQLQAVLAVAAILELFLLEQVLQELQI